MLELGVGAILDGDPPVATVYHFNAPPVLIVAVKVDAVAFLQYII